MNNVLSWLLLIAFVLLLTWQLVGLVKDIIKKVKSKKEKSQEGDEENWI